jgi:hypothetical protein
VKEHWADIEKNVPPFQMGFLASFLARACTPPERDEAKAFYEAHPTAGGERRMRQSLERIDACIAFHNNQAANLATFLGNGATGGESK